MPAPTEENPSPILLDELPMAAILCDGDGQICHMNKLARDLIPGGMGKHAARLAPELADALNRLRLGLKPQDNLMVELGNTLHRVHVRPRGRHSVLLTFTPQLRDSRQELELRQYRAAFDSTSDGMWIVDGDGTICSINKHSEQLNGIRARQVVGQNIEDILSEGIMDRSVTMEVLRLKRQASFVQNIGPSGKHLHVTGTPCYDERGEIEFVVVVEKDVTDLKHMRSTVEETRRARDKAREMLTELTMKDKDDGDPAIYTEGMRTVFDAALKLSRLECRSVLLSGEPGTGKYAVAQYMHRQGPRQNGPFININCAALPPGLQEAELFGYERGAVPGIPGKGKAGLLGLAEGGTFLLEDVGVLPPQTQAKLLRCLNDGTYLPLGSRTPKNLRCTLLATANDELERLVARGLFRDDLYHKLNMFRLRLPPLRERPADIITMAKEYLKRANQLLGTDLTLTPHALSLLQQQRFPGNANELEGILKQAAALSEGSGLESALERLLNTNMETPSHLRQNATLSERLEEVEREVLERTRLVCTSTRDMAEKLGISQPSVVRKLRKHKIAPPRSN